MHNYVTAQESLTLFLSHNKLTIDVSYFLINKSKTKTFIDLTVTRKPVRSLKPTKNRTGPNRNEIPTHFIHEIKKKGYDRIGVTVFMRQKGVNFIPPILLISAVQSFKSVLLYCYRNETTGEHALYVIKFNCLLTISFLLARVSKKNRVVPSTSVLPLGLLFSHCYFSFAALILHMIQLSS